MIFKTIKSTAIKPEKTYQVIGLMSGTSLDGLDIACCNFSENEKNTWRYKIVQAQCVPYSENLAKRLNEAVNFSGLELIGFHKEYGLYVAEKVLEFIKAHRLNPQIISSHGHTVFHDPERNISFQLGDGASIYARTGRPVVCDFRSVDVLLGGQGAPLVPIGDKLLFIEYDFCLNLGGIANISYDNSAAERVAYDISPCNLLLNLLARELGKKYDKDGQISASGSIDTGLLDNLNKWKYYKTIPPKSLDKEQLLAELIPLLQLNINVQDKLATVTEHIAQQIASSVKQAQKPDKAKMLMTGGGALNKHLVSRVQYHLPDTQCIVPDKNIVNFKEALIFAFLGLLRVLGRPNCLASVTGAEKDNIGGALYGNFSNF